MGDELGVVDGGEDGAEEDRDEGEGEARGVGWKAPLNPSAEART
jgi:hypothetical protein